VFPLVALLSVGAAAAAVSAWERGPAWRRRLVVGWACAAALWPAVATALAWPNGISYVNELWGGTRRGHRLVSDSNYDWGQGLKELSAWQGRHGGPLACWYFGTDPGYARLPLEDLPLHARPIRSPEDALEQVRGKRVAVSATLLCNPPLTDPIRQAVRFFRGVRPVARTTTFFIYDFTGAARVSR
jgi:hypothetical protein